MSCPICNHVDLEEGVESCTKCGSDLEIFTHIENARKADTFQRKSMLTLAGVLGVVMVSWGSVSLLSGGKETDTEIAAVTESAVVATEVEDPLNMADAGKPIEEFAAESSEPVAEMSPVVEEAKVAANPEPLPAEKAAAPAKPIVKEKAKHVGPTFEADGYIIHKVRKGDSFWKISKRYFGSGKHAKRIAKDNNLNPKKDIPLGTKLTIKK